VENEGYWASKVGWGEHHFFAIGYPRHQTWLLKILYKWCVNGKMIKLSGGYSIAMFDELLMVCAITAITL